MPGKGGLRPNLRRFAELRLLRNIPYSPEHGISAWKQGSIFAEQGAMASAFAEANIL